MKQTDSIQSNRTAYIKFEKDSQYDSPDKVDDTYHFVFKGLLSLINNYTDKKFSNISIEGQIEDIAAYISFYITIYNQKHKYRIELDVPEDFEQSRDMVLPD